MPVVMHSQCTDVHLICVVTLGPVSYIFPFGFGVAVHM